MIYVSLGTVPLFSQPSLFNGILQGLEQHDVDVIVTIGEHNDVSSLGPQPANVHVERWPPPPLPRCTAAICHAGSGTRLAALGVGVPLRLPQGADQFENAAACARAGVARLVTPDAFSAESVAAGLATVLSDPRHGLAAQRVCGGIVAMSSRAEVVPLLHDVIGRSSSHASAEVQPGGEPGAACTRPSSDSWMRSGGAPRHRYPP